jgi:hypothetical protein
MEADDVAKQVITRVTDDLDGSEGAKAHTFAVDGKTYRIDLGEKSYEKLTKALAPFIEQAVVQRSSNGTARPVSGKPDRPYDLVALRAWAKKNKVAVPSRGRIPSAVVSAYQAAGGS